jgi:cytochrome c556
MMRGGSTIIVILLVAAVGAQAASPEDGQAAFAHRVDTMKRMGRAFYTTIGKVVRGKAPLDQQTVDAADTIVNLSATIPTLFPAGSDVKDSQIKPEIFAAGAQVAQLAAGVQAAADRLATAAKSGDQAALTAAYKAQDDACEACHRDFRKPVE